MEQPEPLSAPMRADQDERDVVGSCVRWPEVTADVCQRLNANDFYLDETRACFQALAEVRSKGEPTIYTSVCRLLPKFSLNPGVRSGADLLEWAADCVSPVFVTYQIMHIKESANRRRLLASAQVVYDSSLDVSLDLDDAVDRSQRAIALADDNPGSVFDELLDPFTMAIAASRENFGNLDGEESGSALSFGLRELDRVTSGGARPGQFIVVGGYTGDGKSIVLRSFAQSFAQNGTVLFASNEMTPEQIRARDLAHYGQMMLGHILDRRLLTLDEKDALVFAEAEIASTQIYTYFNYAMTTAVLRERALALKERVGLVAVVVDYIQRMTDPGERALDRVGFTAKKLKSLALELGVPVVAGSQINRSNQDDLDYRPNESVLRETGELAQESDVVLMLYRASRRYADEAAWKIKHPREPFPANVLEINIAKQRQGQSPVTIKVGWVGAYATISNLTER